MFGIGGAGGDIVGALTSVVAPPVAAYFGAQEQNQANRQLARETFGMNQSSAREAMGFEAEQAKQQMAFQERMSNSAYQRAAEDAKKAGLNPILALTGQATTPAGASGGGTSASAPMPDQTSPGIAAASSTIESAKAISSVLSTVMEANMMGAKMENLKASTANMQAETGKKGVETNILRSNETRQNLIDSLQHKLINVWKNIQSTTGKWLEDKEAADQRKIQKRREELGIRGSGLR